MVLHICAQISLSQKRRNTMATITKITMSAKSFRRIENPFEKDGKKMYLAVIQAKELPKELSDCRKINPRDPKTKS